MTYTVRVDDNFHYMDKECRHTHGEYETLEAALKASKAIVDGFLASAYTPGMSAEDLYQIYTSLGDDPFIIGLGGCAVFRLDLCEGAMRGAMHPGRLTRIASDPAKPMNGDEPPRTLSDVIKACGTLVVYAGCALSFFAALFSGRFQVAITNLCIAQLVARRAGNLSQTPDQRTLRAFRPLRHPNTHIPDRTTVDHKANKYPPIET